jgi:hypothetical protein
MNGWPLKSHRRQSKPPTKQMQPTCGTARLNMVNQPPHEADLRRSATEALFDKMNWRTPEAAIDQLQIQFGQQMA